ncbi:MAG: GNAT family N-acetyltransferase [Flavobacteriales bacterium]
MEAGSIQHEEENGRFVSKLGVATAFLAYEKQGRVIDLYSTYVPEAFRGKGIAGKLVEEALNYARKNGYMVLPSCPYVAAYIEHHQEHLQLKA